MITQRLPSRVNLISAAPVSRSSKAFGQRWAVATIPAIRTNGLSQPITVESAVESEAGVWTRDGEWSSSVHHQSSSHCLDLGERLNVVDQARRDLTGRL